MSEICFQFSDNNLKSSDIYKDLSLQPLNPKAEQVIILHVFLVITKNIDLNYNSVSLILLCILKVINIFVCVASKNQVFILKMIMKAIILL